MKRCALVLLTAAWFAAAAHAGLPDNVELPSRAGAVTFSHAPHADIGCTDCHHTSRDGVEEGCRACHTATSTTARTGREAFHASCIGCHLKQLKAGGRTGPAKRCSACHVQRQHPSP